MEWRIFTYKKAQHNDNKLSFDDWLFNLANKIRAEQVQILGENKVLLYYPSPYRDDFDANGEAL